MVNWQWQIGSSLAVSDLLLNLWLHELELRHEELNYYVFRYVGGEGRQGEGSEWEE